MSALGLFVLSPLLLLIAVAIVVDSPGGPIFAQTRIGKDGRPFRLYKFRSMIPNASLQGKGYYFDGERDPRITRVGRFLRRTSLDELPELYNVLRGDMSLVGPRPMLPYQHKHLSREQKLRVSVRPGITGLAQTSGRNRIPWSKRIEYDLSYIEQLSLGLDLKILWRTIIATVRSQDIDHSLRPEQVEDFLEEVSPDEHSRKASDAESA